MQRTFTVGEDKIKIRTRRRTYMGNPVGYYVTVNGDKMHVGVLDEREAMDKEATE
jgi:hypothetical protein